MRVFQHSYKIVQRNQNLAGRGETTVTQYQTNVLLLSRVLTHTPMKPTPLWRRSQNQNWRQRSHRKPPEEQRVTVAVDHSWTQYGHVFPRRTTYLPEYWSDTLPFPRRPFCEDHILQSNQLITFSFPVADNWVSSAKPLGSRPPYDQTFPAKELVIVVKAFPITTTHQSQGIWGTAQNNKVVVVSHTHTHTLIHL